MLICTSPPSFVTDWCEGTGSSWTVFIFFSESVFQINLTPSLSSLFLPFSSVPLLCINWIFKSLQFLLVFEEKKCSIHKWIWTSCFVGLHFLGMWVTVLKFFLWGCWRGFFLPSWEYCPFHVFKMEFSFSFLLLEENEMEHQGRWLSSFRFDWSGFSLKKKKDKKG